MISFFKFKYINILGAIDITYKELIKKNKALLIESYIQNYGHYIYGFYLLQLNIDFYVRLNKSYQWKKVNSSNVSPYAPQALLRF